MAKRTKLQLHVNTQYHSLNGSLDSVNGDPLYQIWYKSTTEGFWANGWNITKIIIIYLYLFFFDQPTGQTRGWIFTRDSSKDVQSRKDVPFWGYKT